MADDKKLPDAPPMPLPPTANVAPSPASSETVPGGRYIVDGVAVDSEGRPLKDQKKEE